MQYIERFRINYLIGFFVIIGLGSCSQKVTYPSPDSVASSYGSTLSAEKQIAYNFVTALASQEVILDSLLDKNFLSHDQKWEGQRSDFMQQRKADRSFLQITPIRILQDSSLVAVHSRVLGDTLRFRWDILRITDQRIQEHWSNMQDSLKLNPDGHSEIDGPTIPTQLEKTADNRSLITRFIDQCMIREDGGASKFFNFGLYIQHNRDVGDGINGLLWGMVKMKMQGNVIKFRHNYHIIAEGNFVLSATEGIVGDKKTAFYDLFRIENNKIIEHWDVIAPISKPLKDNYITEKQL